VTYLFISAEKATHHVRTLCRVLGVSASGYYAWSSRPPSARSLRDVDLRRAIVRIHQASRGTYGRPRIHAELRSQGTRCSGKRVARLMRETGIRGIPEEGDAGASPAAARGSPPIPIWSVGGSPPRSPIGCGWPTSPTSPPGRGGCTWPPSWTAALGGSWGGRWPPICARSWWWTPWRWPPR
jgi:transposase InsO family protein